MSSAYLETTYGFPTVDISAARGAVEDALGFTMTERESLYQGGVYYLFESPGLEVRLRSNLDLLDKVRREQVDAAVLVEVSDMSDSAATTSQLEKSLPSLIRIRRRQGGRAKEPVPSTK